MQDDGSYANIESGYSVTDTTIINRFIAFKNPFRYRSYYYDFETNLYYLNSRYYDPQIGRFINADDISTLDITQIALNGLNLYAYCLNNPVNETDENGYFLLWLFISAILVGAAIGGTSNGIKAYNEGARGWSLFGAILGGAIVGGAMGGILTFGGVTALGVISGFSLASGLMLSTGIGIIAGWTSYSIEAAFRDNIKWNVFDFGLAGISGGLKGFATFGMGFMGGKLGAFDKIILNPLLKGAKTLDMSITYSLTKIIFGRTIFLTPIAEFLFKIVAISGISSGIRSLIDKLIKKLKK